MKRLLITLGLLLLVAPVAAQTTAPPNNPVSAGGGSGSGGRDEYIYRIIANDIVRQAIDAAIAQGEATPEPPPVVRKPAPQFRDVVVPPRRPEIFAGRPLPVDAAYEPHTLLVVLEPGSDAEATGRALAQRFGLSVVDIHQFDSTGAMVVRFGLPDFMSVEDAMRAMRGASGVLSVQPSYLFRGTQSASAPSDLTPLQYAPARLNALVAHRQAEGQGVTIGLIDTGVDLAQPALAAADITTYDVLGNRMVVNRDHGTALAGLMVANASIDSIAPEAHLISVRAFDTDEGGTAISGSYELARAIELAVDEGARVLNLSFAGPRDPLVMSVLDAAAARGVILVAAAGNGGPDAAPAYPGAHRDAIAVTATDSHDAIFSGANRGFYIAVAAPGVDVLSPLPDDRFELLSGTSIATAHVTGIVALLLQRRPDLDADAIRALLQGSAQDLGAPGADADFGGGLADAAAAVAAAQ